MQIHLKISNLFCIKNSNMWRPAFDTCFSFSSFISTSKIFYIIWTYYAYAYLYVFVRLCFHHTHNNLNFAFKSQSPKSFNKKKRRNCCLFLQNRYTILKRFLYILLLCHGNCENILWLHKSLWVTHCVLLLKFSILYVKILFSALFSIANFLLFFFLEEK